MGIMAFLKKPRAPLNERQTDPRLREYGTTGLSPSRLRSIGKRIQGALTTQAAPSQKRWLNATALTALAVGGIAMLVGVEQSSLPSRDVPAPIEPAGKGMSSAQQVTPGVMVKSVEQRAASTLRQQNSLPRKSKRAVALPIPKEKAKADSDKSVVKPTQNGTLAIQLRLYNEAVSHFDNGHWARANAKFRRLIRTYPDSPLEAEVYYRLVVGLSFEGKCLLAMSVFKEARNGASEAEKERLRRALSTCNEQKPLSSP